MIGAAWGVIFGQSVFCGKVLNNTKYDNFIETSELLDFSIKTMFCNIYLANVLHKYKYFIITDFFL